MMSAKSKFNAKPNENKAKGKGKSNQKGKANEDVELVDLKDEMLEDEEEEFDEDDEEDDEEDDDLELFWQMKVLPNEENLLEQPSQFNGIVCITNACFGKDVKKDSRTVVCCQTPVSEEPTPVCILNQGTHENQRLNLRFGSAASFTLQGRDPSTVYLTGFVDIENIGDMDSFPEDFNMDDLPAKYRYPAEDEDSLPVKPANKKRKVETAAPPKKAEQKKQPPQKKETAPQQKKGKAPPQQKKETAPPQKKETPPQPQPPTPTTENNNNNNDNSNNDAKTNDVKTNDVKTDAAKSQDKPLSKNQQKKLKKLQKKQAQETTTTTTTTITTTTATTANNNKPKEENAKTDTNQPKETASSTKAPEKTSEIATDHSETKEQTETKDDQTKPKKNANSETSLSNGVTYKDVKHGTGEEIKNGQTVLLYYVGQLEDKKVFDKVLSGAGFEYKFGSEEPVKGWNVGLQGMKVGGKRRIVLPSRFAYGEQGLTDKVPANATVTFTVEIRSTK
jgi:FKBP-type peptidyl-prolyl cis-trans isomerase